MTSAEQINRELAEMEEMNGGDCVHKSILVSTKKVPYKFPILWRCDKCGIQQYGEKYGIMQSIPDRLSDGAYILGLERKLLKDGYYIYFNEYYNDYVVAHCIDENGNEELLEGAKSLEHAIALAAIKKEGNQ